jgi:hypothetical protein
LGDGADVLAGHAFVEHGVGQRGQARRIAVLAAAGGEDQAHVEHRQLMGFDEQHLGAFGGVPVCTSSLRLAGALPSSSASDCSCWLVWALSSASLATDLHRAADRRGRADQGDGDQAEQQACCLRSLMSVSSGRTWATLRRSRVK